MSASRTTRLFNEKLAYERAIAEGERLAALSELRGVDQALAVCDAWMEQDNEALQALLKEDHDGWWDLACRDFLVAAYRDLAASARKADRERPKP